MHNAVSKIPVVGQFSDYLKGAPDQVLTVALLGVAVFAVVVAMFGDPIFKAIALAWIVIP